MKKHLTRTANVAAILVTLTTVLSAGSVQAQHRVTRLVMLPLIDGEDGSALPGLEASESKVLVAR